ncbi:MAG: hypothetical protein PWP53_1393 [Lacrimispora sp.]|nr:hypothetical protein [Lacrimispora sp.]
MIHFQIDEFTGQQCVGKERLNIKFIKNTTISISENQKITKRIFAVLGTSTVMTAFVMSILQSLCFPAYAVTVDGARIGVVDDPAVYTQAVTSVETQAAGILGEEYKFASNIDVSMTIVGKDELSTEEDIRVSLLNQVNEIEKSYVLKVDGVTIGSSTDRSSLQRLLDELSLQYTNENTKTYQFEQDVSISYEYTAADTLSNPSAIREILTANTEEAVSYTVTKGDTYSEIANDNGLRFSELMALNPQASVDELMIGNVLNIKNAIPFLSVRTVESVTYTEAIESPVEYIDDVSLYVGETQMKTEGLAGEAQVTAEVTYVNSKEIDRTITETKTLTDPTKTIIAKGVTPRPKTASYGSYIWPLSGKVTSTTGNRNLLGSANYHSGLDIAAPYGTNVKASDGGLVTFAGWNGSYGNLVIITHDNGTQTYYAHNSSLLVSKGERVYRGQAIAKVGSTGRSTGNHSHFEVRVDGSIRNPYDFL